MITTHARTALFTLSLGCLSLGAARAEQGTFPALGEDLQADRLAKVLHYEERFESEASLARWSLEGPGEKRWEKGRMLLVNDASAPLIAAWEAGGRKPMDGKPEAAYTQTVEAAVRQKHPEMLEKMYDARGRLTGGHIVCWNAECVTPEDFLIEYDFRPLSPIGLAIVQFAAKGRGGEDVLDKSLAPRYGVFLSYIRGDINCYHVSYFANAPTYSVRGTCNLRKNHGFFLVATGPDLCSNDLDWAKPFEPHTYKISVLKKGPKVRFYIDNRFVLGLDDKRHNDVLDDEGKVKQKGVDTGEPLGGGRIGLRQMAGLIGAYSNFRVYRLNGQ